MHHSGHWSLLAVISEHLCLRRRWGRIEGTADRRDQEPTFLVLFFNGFHGKGLSPSHILVSDAYFVVTYLKVVLCLYK